MDNSSGTPIFTSSTNSDADARGDAYVSTMVGGLVGTALVFLAYDWYRRYGLDQPTWHWIAIGFLLIMFICLCYWAVQAWAKVAKMRRR